MQLLTASPQSSSLTAFTEFCGVYLNFESIVAWNIFIILQSAYCQTTLRKLQISLWTCLPPPSCCLDSCPDAISMPSCDILTKQIIFLNTHVTKWTGMSGLLDNQSSFQSIKFIISVAHCRLDFTINSRKNTSAMLNVNTTKITIVDKTRECLSRQMMLTYSVW